MVEEYLKRDYDMFEDERYLKQESDIIPYFKENGDRWLNCGQGYAEDEKEIHCKIGNKYYEVNIVAQIESSKQDRGDRLYWVEYIKNVTYEEIEKPKPLPRVTKTVEFSLPEFFKPQFEEYLHDVFDRLSITFKIKDDEIKK